MAYIFMDESGCLGFDFKKKGTSQNFIITFLFASSKRPLEKIVRRAFQKMDKKERKRLAGALHCHKAHPRLRLRVLNELRQVDDVSVMLIRLNKRKVFTHLQDEKAVLYNFVTTILLDRIINQKILPADGKVHLIAARRETNRFLNENYKSYLKEKSKKKLDIDISIRVPTEEKGLQIADFISWSAFRYYEHADDTYFEVIKRLVVQNSTLFGSE